MGRQPDIGFTLCSRYSLIVSCCMRCLSLPCLRLISSIIGCSAMVLTCETIILRLSGHITIRTMTPMTIRTHP